MSGKDFSIKRKKFNSPVMNVNNYDIKINGESISGERIKKLELVMDADCIPELIVTYGVHDLEIDGLVIDLKELEDEKR